MGNCCASEETGPRKASHNRPIEHPISAGERMYNKYDADSSSFLSSSSTEKFNFANNLIYYESKPSSRETSFIETNRRSRPVSPISTPRPKANNRLRDRSVSPSRNDRPSPTIPNPTPSKISSPNPPPSQIHSSPNLFNISTLTAPRRQLGRAAEGDLLNVVFKAIKRVSTPAPGSRCMTPEPVPKRSNSVSNQEPEVSTTSNSGPSDDESQAVPKFKKYNMGFERSLLNEFRKSREKILSKHNV
jgi:hypothetical protein